MIRKLFGLVLVFAFAGAAPAMAQLPGLEFEPYLGVYLPVQDVIDQTVAVPGLGDTKIVGSQKEALALGGRLSLWLGGIGVEGNVMYAFSDAEATTGTEVSDTSAYVWTADARLAFRFGVPLAPVSFHINGGVAMIGRGGDAYDALNADGKTDIGGVIGAGARVKLPGIFGIRVDGNALLYSAQITVDDDELGQVEFDSKLQADVILTAGLVFGIGP